MCCEREQSVLSDSVLLYCAISHGYDDVIIEHHVRHLVACRAMIYGVLKIIWVKIISKILMN